MSQSQQGFQLSQAGPEHAVFQKDAGTITYTRRR
jgi:hypothetical protein